MNKEVTLLIGKWEFVGAEVHDDLEWKPIDYIEGMVWEFYPQFFNETKIIGNITETTPTSQPTSLNYTYNSIDNLLRIEVYTDLKIKILDETDIFEVEPLYHHVMPNNKLRIRLSIINQLGSPPPYLRYTLEARD